MLDALKSGEICQVRFGLVLPNIKPWPALEYTLKLDEYVRLELRVYKFDEEQSEHPPT